MPQQGAKRGVNTERFDALETVDFEVIKGRFFNDFFAKLNCVRTGSHPPPPPLTSQIPQLQHKLSIDTVLILKDAVICYC